MVHGVLVATVPYAASSISLEFRSGKIVGYIKEATYGLCSLMALNVVEGIQLEYCQDDRDEVNFRHTGCGAGKLRNKIK